MKKKFTITRNGKKYRQILAENAEQAAKLFGADLIWAAPGRARLEVQLAALGGSVGYGMSWVI